MDTYASIYPVLKLLLPYFPKKAADYDYGEFFEVFKQMRCGETK